MQFFDNLSHFMTFYVALMLFPFAIPGVHHVCSFLSPMIRVVHQALSRELTDAAGPSTGRSRQQRTP